MSAPIQSCAPSSPAPASPSISALLAVERSASASPDAPSSAPRSSSGFFSSSV
jgi:hypothetical protein